MRENTSWSFGIGRWAGASLRIHVLLVATCIFVVDLTSRDLKWMSISVGLIGILIWLGSLLWHELGHWLMTARFGGHVERVTFMPWGGIAQAQISHEAAVAVAGPLANLLLVVLLAPFFFFAGGENQFFDSLRPMGPAIAPDEPLGMMIVKLATWLNWLLFLVNVLPAFPLDGGRLFHAILRPNFGSSLAAAMVCRWCAHLTVLCLVASAWFFSDSASSSPVRPMLPLLLLATYLLFYAWNELHRHEDPDADDGLLNYDFSQGYTSLERHFDGSKSNVTGSFRRWLANRREIKRQRTREIEIEEERRVDEILVRVQDCGISGLTPDERSLLERVSARYRNRQQN